MIVAGRRSLCSSRGRVTLPIKSPVSQPTQTAGTQNFGVRPRCLYLEMGTDIRRKELRTASVIHASKASVRRPSDRDPTPRHTAEITGGRAQLCSRCRNYSKHIVWNLGFGLQSVLNFKFDIQSARHSLRYSTAASPSPYRSYGCVILRVREPLRRTQWMPSFRRGKHSSVTRR